MKSLDQVDRESFAAGPAPHSGEARTVQLLPGAFQHPAPPLSLSLDGDWLMAAGGKAETRLAGDFNDAILAVVPGSIQTALLHAGRIPDPYVGKNDEIARAESFKTWWLLREFEAPAEMEGARLVFGGICDSCAIWLNGEKLGEHKGMFADIVFDVSSRLKTGLNQVIVRLDPAPYRVSQHGEPNDPGNDFFIGMNVGWLDTAVINNIYGWHYINLPTLGIWRPVSLKSIPPVEIVDPFVATLDAPRGLMRLNVKLRSAEPGFQGKLSGTITPENFSGDSYLFSLDVNAASGETSELLEFTIPDARLWQPVDCGDPNLYRLTLSFQPTNGAADRCDFTFGIRTIEMRPLPSGPDPETYNWTFVVNGKPIFVKGANWCTIDALLRFERERYARFLDLARDSHLQLLRAWGSGMPETDDFYDIADRNGIMILQEWPTAWNSHEVQPFDILEETVRRSTIRLRNHPSLIMYGGGNESSRPFGDAIDMMGRHSIELDGTRPFHRGEPWGGSIHSYRVYWGREPLDSNLSLSAPFIGEFGLASMPVEETALRYLPPDERDTWPPASDGAFTHHMPVFNLKGGQAIMNQYVADFLPNDSLRNFIIGTQMAQATGMRHTLELARTRYPDATGVCYYKLTDNNPAASWATVDWHGSPKIAYHMLRGAFRPLHACLLFHRFSFVGVPVSLPVYLLDDNDSLASSVWRVDVRAYGSQLQQIAAASYEGETSPGRVARIGNFALDVDQTWNCPLFIVAEVNVGGQLRDRVFYWMNFSMRQGSLFDRPRTQLAIEAGDANTVLVSNIGALPAVAVHFDCPEISRHFSCSDSYFWLNPGETRPISVSQLQGVRVAAWNADAVGLD